MRIQLVKNYLLLLIFLFGFFSIQAQHAPEIETAFQYLHDNAKKLNLSATDIYEAQVSDFYTSKHNQVTHLYLLQHLQEIEVFGGLMNITITRDGAIFNVGNKFIPFLNEKVNTFRPQISMEKSIQSVLANLNLNTNVPILLSKEINDKEATFQTGLMALEPVRVQLNYFQIENGDVRLAWKVHFFENSTHYWEYQIDAVNSNVLFKENTVIQCEFGGNHANHNCTGNYHNKNASPKIVEKLTVTGNGTYRVFPLEVESPNHGEQILVDCPADLIASPFGWHDTLGVEGPDVTITRGNNVHAYQDILDLNMSVGGEPDGGDTLLFDFPFDTASVHPYTQIDAATVNTFYWNNIIHDVLYHYGFDEESGNFQLNNYGNGGLGGDDVHAEIMDGSGIDNANFRTPDDGENPRMQMYVWGGDLVDNQSSFQVLEPASLFGYYPATMAQFGDSLPTSYASAIVAGVGIVQDSTDIFTDGCEEILNPDELAGKIVLLDQSDSCSFGSQVLRAENAGAIAVVVCSDAPNLVFSMPSDDDGDQVTIPALMVSQNTCLTIRDSIETLSIRLVQEGSVAPFPGPVGRDSDFDNGVIVHEYGHGVSNRLTGGPGVSNCLRNQPEQAGEGWSDFFALAFTTTNEMTAEQPRGIGTYVSFEPTDGQGIRTHPYSRDMNINPHTYANIHNESIPHGRGSIWCVTLWDLYWNLVDVYGFDDDLYNGTGGNNIAIQLVMDGMKLQVCRPNFIDSRDAILMADLLNYDGAHQCLIWETFARRGMGVSAFPDGKEAFDLPGVTIKKFAPETAFTTDTITYTLKVANGPIDTLFNPFVTDTLPMGVTYLEGSASCPVTVLDNILTFEMEDLQECEVISCTYQVVIDSLPFSVLRYEDKVNIPFQWDRTNDGAGLDFGLHLLDAHSNPFSFFAESDTFQTHQYLTMKNPVLLEGENPAFSFWHKINAEIGFDGGVVEFEINGGDWIDANEFVLFNGYNGEIDANAVSVIAGQPAFTGLIRNFEESIYDLSTFSGTEFRVRFRYATNDSVAGQNQGWIVDDFRVFDKIQLPNNVACFEDNDGTLLCDNAFTTIYEKIIDNTFDREQNLPEITVFPNPTENYFQIKSAETINGKVILQLLSLDGKTLLERNLNQLISEEVNIQNVASGLYLLRIATEKGVLTKKIVVQ